MSSRATGPVLWNDDDVGNGISIRQLFEVRAGTEREPAILAVAPDICPCRLYPCGIGADAVHEFDPAVVERLGQFGVPSLDQNAQPFPNPGRPENLIGC